MTTPEQPVVTVGDRYVLVERLAADPHHETWRGHDDLAGRQVVVVRFAALDPERRQSLRRRAQALEALTEPGMASVLGHDGGADQPWLATAYVEGEPAAVIAADPGLTADDALAVVGQVAMALGTLHGAGLGHGALDGEHVLVRPDGSTALIGFAMDREVGPAEDLPALARLAHELLGATSDNPDHATFLKLLDAGDWHDVSDIGRTALALAAAQRAGSSMPVEPASDADSDGEPAAPEPRRPWYDEAERKRVRNRLIALGTIVVIGGAILLYIFNAGSGETSVPSVVGVPYVEAQHDLNEVGLRGSETVTTGPPGTEGTVLAQHPAGGEQAKVGSVVELTVAATQ